MAENRLDVSTRLNRKTLKTLKERGIEPPKPQVLQVKLLPNDLWVVVEGLGKGTRGEWQLENGKVKAINLGGRLYPKIK